MAVSDRTTLKNFFGTGQVPLAQHFADLVDSALNQQEDGVTKSSSTPLAITTGSVENSRRQGILFLSGEELPMFLQPIVGTEGSFSLQFPPDNPTDHLRVVFAGTSADTPTVTLVQGPIPGGETSSLVLDPTDTSHLRIFIPTASTAIENLTELTTAVNRGGFTITREGTATFNLQPSFPNGQWHLGLQDDVPGGTPLTGGLYIGNGDQQALFIQNQTGFVGIGTNAPTVALEVNGGLKVDGLDVKVTLDGLVTAVNAAGTGLVAKVGTLETTVGHNAILGAGDVVVKEATGLVKDVAGLEGRVGTLETQIGTATDDISATTLFGKIADLNTRLSALEAQPTEET